MGGQELSMKFSNDMYATKADVKREMKTGLIDGIWTEILKYRSNFNVVLKLRHVDSTAYVVCLTPKISERVNSIERKLIKLSKNYSDLCKIRVDKEFDIISKTKILKTIAKLYGVEVNDSLLYSISNGTLTNLAPEYLILTRYLKCIDEIGNFANREIDDNTIGNFYSELLGTDDLTEYYRTKDFENKFSKYITGRVYLGIPCGIIDRSMDQLLNFVQYSDISAFIKAICTFYYLYYVKPFETHNEEIAVLMLKKILAFNDYDKVASLINFEQLLMDKDNLESVVFECQRTYDLTYFLSYCLKMVDKLIDGALDDVANAEKIGVKHDYYQSEGYPNNVPELNRVNTLEDNKAPQVTPSFVNENTKVEHEEVKVATKETIKVEPIKVATSEVEKIPEPVTKKPEQKIEEIKESDFINTTSKQTFAHESVSDETGTMVNFAQNIAISNLPTGLSEEEASKLENHLLELNPYLTRGQAYFYARHCTIGMCYTISQYKKEVGCAYETARCSMDNLVTLGYYVKKQLKNKYIYTPVKKG